MEGDVLRTLFESFGSAGAALAIAYLFYKHLTKQIDSLEAQKAALETRVNELQDERAEELAEQIRVFGILTRNGDTAS